jgi:nicotinamidase-related amidase
MLIDQQKGIDHPKLGERNNPSAETQMLKLLKVWRGMHWPICHIKHRSRDPESVFWPEQDGFEFKLDFRPQSGEYVVEKIVPCAFVNSSLEQQLDELGIGRVAIAGVATNNSVEATARTGGNLGLKVWVIEDACFTFAKKDYFGQQRTAAEVHAMSLANLDGEYATVLSTDRLLSQIRESHD